MISHRPSNRGRHLSDDRLVEIYFAGSLGESIEPVAAEHLAACAECHARASELTDFLDGVRADGDTAADEVFTSDRLRRQHDHILRRLEHLNRPARVLSFPGRVTRRISIGARRVTPRWLAAAAAAGLFVGAVSGRLLPGTAPPLPGMHVVGARPPALRTSMPPAMHAPASMPASLPVPMMDTFDDVKFMMELELALGRMHPRELQPFDALTPHVREIASRVR